MFYLVRIIVVDVIIEFRGVVKGIVNEKYKIFDEKFVNLDILEFVFFDEKIYCSLLFCMNM